MVDIPAGSHQVRIDTARRTLGAISVAHWVRHFHIFVLPMLFPFLKDRLGVSYVDLGLALTVFAVVSGLTQAPIGYLVDRIGARKILILGMTLGGAALIALGLHLSYPTLIVCAALLGLANSVYHPADYAILSAHMDETRMGRAFSIHSFAGFLGGAVAPAIMAALVAGIGGASALIVAGLIGLAVVLMLVVVGIPDAGAMHDATEGEPAAKVSMMNPAILLLTLFFTLLALSQNGINSFGIVALISGYGISFSAANIALTAYLGCSAAGVLVGGVLADRTVRHGQIAAGCFAINAAIVFTIASVTMPLLLLTLTMAVAGFLSGVIVPSRDMLVRNAAPPGAAGRAFGIVSTGFNFGGIVSPILFGWLMDSALPGWVFGASAAFMAATVVLALVSEKRPTLSSRTSER
ncbi:MFS transporter [Tardiphaga sp. vice352]|uniref:MFS transporter n=1 Tax=unclassified Tardiphaga TaxID=2631404 RepID=UPI0011651404|nr:MULTISPECIES: MFS transporter [unclassified Tardiphaga]QDM19029.1 MFS transporter [Tardiphaga sp. vice278]QDM29232.1 MFS transporter [Tardiphaga sp. vice304]QDM34332.1 MFS transporter [Tardiphaga sp. vice352]